MHGALVPLPLLSFLDMVLRHRDNFTFVKSQLFYVFVYVLNICQLLYISNDASL